jgi:hypothetical protein
MYVKGGWSEGESMERGKRKERILKEEEDQNIYVQRQHNETHQTV